MKQTNLLNYRLGMSRSGIAKPLGFIAACLAVLFVFGLQKASAQTMGETGELSADHTITLIKGEMQFLEQEMKYPVGNVNTTKNGQLIAYYRNVINMYQKGSDLKDAFKNIGPANTPVQNSGASSSFAGIAQSNSEAIIKPADLKAYSGQIDQLNILDSDDSDLIAIFNLLRTLKNQ